MIPAVSWQASHMRVSPSDTLSSAYILCCRVPRCALRCCAVLLGYSWSWVVGTTASALTSISLLRSTSTW